MADAAGLLTTTVNLYAKEFFGYVHQFLQWGQEFFYVGLVITVVWLCLWNAFDKHGFQEAMPNFLKEFFVIALFYTIMLNAQVWLGSIVDTSSYMGKFLTKSAVDPSSIMSQGLAIAGKIAIIADNTSILTQFFGVLILFAAYALVFFAFATVALELSLVLILNYLLIGMSGFLLAFAVFPFTRSIARKTLDLVIANSIKLLVIYVVVAAGTSVFEMISKTLPSDPAAKVTNFDIYSWVVLASLLFWMLAKNIPMQVSRIFSDVIQETHGASAAAVGLTAMALARTAVPAINAAAGGAAGIAKIAGSTVGNMGAHFNQAKSSGSGAAASIGKAIGGAAKDAKSSVLGNLSDQYHHITDRLQGGKGMVDDQGNKNIPSFAQRMYHAAQGAKNMPPSGAPSSAGRKAAGSSSTRSIPKSKKT